jgi:hypothetical protein
MADRRRSEHRDDYDRASEYMRGGKGRRDEVGGSGIYPASASDAPSDAEVRPAGEFVKHKGRKETTDKDR